MELQSEISEAKLAARRGQRLEVMVDAVEGDRAVGRTRGDAPDIDGVVHLELASGLRPGDRVTAEVHDSDIHDLYGRYVGQPLKLK
jgi:ribosomal protein S12 methylthiotransferase